MAAPQTPKVHGLYKPERRSAVSAGDRIGDQPLSGNVIRGVEECRVDVIRALISSMVT